MSKTALITGITGQDGAYLAKFLLDKGYKVYGTYRRLSTPNFWRLQHLDILGEVELLHADLIDASSMAEAIRSARPDEVYHLAAQSFVGASFEEAVGTGQITGLGVARILEAMRQFKDIKFYQASTSELYGAVSANIQTEETPLKPRSPYAAAKLYGYWMTKIYREAYGLFACNGILFNHESPLRGLEFVTRKISNAVARIYCGIDKDLHLGNLAPKRDWGYAPDYVECMWLMLQQDVPDDYVVATGETHEVREFVEKAFAAVDLNWQSYVKTDDKLMRPLEVDLLHGDSGKAKKKLGWKPRVTFDSLVDIMVKADVDRWKRWQKGEHFPWDASFYPTESKTLSRKVKLDK